MAWRGSSDEHPPLTTGSAKMDARDDVACRRMVRLSTSLNFHPNHPKPTLNNTTNAISVRRLKRNRRRAVGLGLVKVGLGASCRTGVKFLAMLFYILQNRQLDTLKYIS